MTDHERRWSVLLGAIEKARAVAAEIVEELKS